MMEEKKRKADSSGGKWSRRTRSQSAPKWTVEETLVLVSEIASLDEEWLKALSSYQKWKMISDSCTAMGVHRSSNQCKRRWESLLSAYNAIRAWQCHSSSSSYWDLDARTRQDNRLPPSFDRHLFTSIAALLNVHHNKDSDSDSDEDEAIIHIDPEDVTTEAIADLGSGEPNIITIDTNEDAMENTEQIEPIKNPNKSLEIADTLQENPQQNQAIKNMDNALQICAIESIESALEMANKQQEIAEQIHVVKSKDNTLEVMGKLQQENTQHAHGVQSVDNAAKMVLLEDNVEQIHATANTGVELEMAKENVLQVHVVESMDNALEMASVLQENAEQIHAIKSIDNAQEIPKKLRENDEEIHVMRSKDNNLEFVKLHENMEQILATERMYSGIKMAYELQKNAEQIHAPLTKKLDAPGSMDNTTEMTNKLHVNVVHATGNMGNKFGMENELQGNAADQMHASKSTGKVLKMANKVKENRKLIHASKSKDKAFKMANNLQENLEQIHVKEITRKATETAYKLQENAKQIHALLRGELPNCGSRGRGLVDLTKPNATETEFTRRQADELIKSFGMLVGTLDQFTDLIKDGRCDRIRGVDSVASSFLHSRTK